MTLNSRWLNTTVYFSLETNLLLVKQCSWIGLASMQWFSIPGGFGMVAPSCGLLFPSSLWQRRRKLVKVSTSMSLAKASDMAIADFERERRYKFPCAQTWRTRFIGYTMSTRVTQLCISSWSHFIFWRVKRGLKVSGTHDIRVHSHPNDTMIVKMG